MTQIDPKTAANATLSEPWLHLTIPVFAVAAALGFIAIATLRWDAWVGLSTVQVTNDAYVRAETTTLSSRVAGEVRRVGSRLQPTDF